MSNSVTDHLGIAEKTYAQSFLRFTYLLKAIPYCDQVVFQDGNISLVNPQGEPPVKIRNGDIIIRVYRNPCSYQLIGTMATKDNYLRAYEIPIEITVSDPIRFARSYLREEDPAKQAINALKQAFERYARKIEHDKIPGVVLSFGEWSRAHLEQFGIHIEQKGKTRFREDPFHTDLSLLNQSWRNQEAKLRGEQRIQRLQDEIKRERERVLQEEEHRVQAKQRDFERQEKTKDQLHEISSNLRQVAAEEIARVLKERILEGFARGHKPGEISYEYFSLVGIFESTKHRDLDKSVIDSGLLVDGSVNSRAENVARSPMSPDDSTNDESTH